MGRNFSPCPFHFINNKLYSTLQEIACTVLISLTHKFMKKYMIIAASALVLAVTPSFAQDQTNSKKADNEQRKADNKQRELDDTKYKQDKKQDKLDKKGRKMNKKHRKVDKQQRSIEKQTQAK